MGVVFKKKYHKQFFFKVFLILKIYPDHRCQQVTLFKFHVTDSVSPQALVHIQPLLWKLPQMVSVPCFRPPKQWYVNSGTSFPFVVCWYSCAVDLGRLSVTTCVPVKMKLIITKIYHPRKLWLPHVCESGNRICCGSKGNVKPHGNSFPSNPQTRPLPLQPPLTLLLCAAFPTGPQRRCFWALLQSFHPDTYRERKIRDDFSWPPHKFYRHFLGRKQIPKDRGTCMFPLNILSFSPCLI